MLIVVAVLILLQYTIAVGFMFNVNELTTKQIEKINIKDN